MKAGKLAPQNKAIQEKWVDAIAADPVLAETLNELKPNAALATVVVNGSGGADTGLPAGEPGEHQFVVKAKAFAAQQKISFADATTQIAAADSALYEDYRRSLTTAAKK